MIHSDQAGASHPISQGFIQSEIGIALRQLQGQAAGMTYYNATQTEQPEAETLDGQAAPALREK